MRRILSLLLFSVLAASSANAAGTLVTKVIQDGTGTHDQYFVDMSGTGIGPFQPTIACVDVNGVIGCGGTSTVTQGSTTAGQSGTLILGAVTTAAPVYTTGQTSPFSLGTNGGARIQGVNTTSTALSNPVPMGVTGTTTMPVLSTGVKTNAAIGTMIGVPISIPHSLPDLTWQYAGADGGITNTTTAVTIHAAQASGIRNYITGLQISSDTLGVATEIAIRDGAAGTVLWRTKLQTAALPQSHITFSVPLRGTAATLLEVVTLTATVTGSVFVNAQGYVAP